MNMMNADNHNHTLVLIPAYNAARYLPELLNRLRRHVAEADLLVVNDGSADETAEILARENVRHINFRQNQGKGAALKAGFEYAMEHSYRSVLTIDADLQHLPEEVPRFLAEDNGQRLVLGVRAIKPKVMPFARWLSNNLTSIIVSVFSSQRVRDSQSGYRLIPVWLLKALRLRRIGYDFESELLFKAGAMGCPVVEVPISTVYEGSPSFINPLADTLRFVRLMWKRVWV